MMLSFSHYYPVKEGGKYDEGRAKFRRWL